MREGYCCDVVVDMGVKWTGSHILFNLSSAVSEFSISNNQYPMSNHEVSAYTKIGWHVYF